MTSAEAVISLPTQVAVMNDGYNHSGYVSQPIMGIYALYQTPPPAASPLGTVDPAEEDEEAKAAKAAVEAKVVTNPGKSAAAKAAAVSDSVETK